MPGHPPSDASAYDQYVEQMPSSTGSRPVGAGAGKKRPLPPRVAQRLRERGGTEAPVLESIASDPQVGAPARPAPATPEVRRELRSEVTQDPDVAAPIGAIGALGDSGDGAGRRVAGLGLALLAITTALVGTAFWRRRRGRPAAS